MAQNLILIITCRASILLSQFVHTHPYRAIEIISHNRDFPFYIENIYISSPRYLYLFINYNSSRVLENDEVHSSSM